MRLKSCAYALCTALMMSASAADARSFNVLYQFGGGADGSGSLDKLLLDGASNVYGVTGQNGTSYGTVFKVAPDGTETVLYAFQFIQNVPADPTGGVISDAQGNLYGEATMGGVYNCSDINAANPDCGSVYKLAPNGTLTELHGFQGDTDGGGPDGGLLMDSSVNLYGTTKFGGTGTFCSGGCGTVFKIATDGTKTTLYNFAGQTDGARPTGALIADAQGNLYGTTSLGGQGFGTVFKIASNGTETQLYAFAGTDGNQPSGGLVMDKSGNLYGSTVTGGPGGGQYGEVFKLTSSGILTILHAFDIANGDGVYPQGALAKDGKGDFFGATTEGGSGCRSYGCGTVFKISKSGTYSQVYRFKGRVAHNPLGGLAIDAQGTLYGNALAGPGQPGILFALDK